MSNYTRFVSYLYEYKDGTKTENRGFAKVEARDDLCKIEIHIKSPAQPANIPFNIFGFARKDSRLPGVLLGSSVTGRGTTFCKLQFHTEQINNTAYGFSDLCGLLIFCENDICFGTSWDDHPIIVSTFDIVSASPKVEAIPSEEKQVSEIAEEMFTDDEPEASMQAASNDISESAEETISPSLTPTDFTPEESSVIPMDSGPEESSVTPTDCVSEESSAAPMDSVPEESSAAPMDCVPEESSAAPMDCVPEEPSVIPMDCVPEESAEDNCTSDRQQFTNRRMPTQMPETENPLSMDQIPSESPVTPENALPHWQSPSGSRIMTPGSQQGLNESENSDQQRFSQGIISDEAAYMETGDNSDFMQNRMRYGDQPYSEIGTPYQTPMYNGTMTSAGSPEQPFQLQQEVESSSCTSCTDDRWNQLQSTYSNVAPFEDDEIVDCIELDLKDLPTLRKSNWLIGSNQFILHSFSNYHHLIMGKSTGEEGSIFILGVPGNYDPKEKFMANMFGFPYFKPCDNKNLHTGQFGYWYRPIS